MRFNEPGNDVHECAKKLAHAFDRMMARQARPCGPRAEREGCAAWRGVVGVKGALSIGRWCGPSAGNRKPVAFYARCFTALSPQPPRYHQSAIVSKRLVAFRLPLRLTDSLVPAISW
jgi:hypothetical protein